MNLRLPLEIHDRLHIGPANSPAPVTWISRVEELAGDTLVVRWPAEGGKPVPISAGQELTIAFGQSSTVHEFEAVVIDMVSEPAPLIAVRPSSPVRSFDRRSDVRVQALVRIELMAKVVRLAAFREARRQQRIRAQTMNLSAGGFVIRYQAAVSVDTVFGVRLALPGERRQPIQVNAAVVRCLPLEGESGLPESYELGFRFLRLSESARSRILRFIFAVQREAKPDD